MEIETKSRNRQIVKGVRLTFLVVLIVFLFSLLTSGIFSFLPPQVPEMISLVIGAIIAFIGCRPEKGTLFKSNNKMTATGFFVMLGAFMLVRLISELVIALLTAVAINEENVSLETFDSTLNNPLMTFLFMCIVTPVCEEIIFRGCIGSNFKKYGIKFAMIMSSVLFALYHLNFLQLVSAFIMGTVLFYIAMNYSVKWSILFHFINNAMAITASQLLKDNIESAAVINGAVYAVEAVFVIIALILMKKDNAAKKVKDFLGSVRDESGVYKASTLNVWFILIIVVFVIMSAMVFMSLNGTVDLSAVNAAA